MAKAIVLSSEMEKKGDMSYASYQSTNKEIRILQAQYLRIFRMPSRTFGNNPFSWLHYGTWNRTFLYFRFYYIFYIKDALFMF